MYKNFTYSKIYNETKGISEFISKMKFKPGVFGEETADFKMLQKELKEMLNSFNPGLELSEDSGFFRKPNNIIHCENVPERLFYVGVLPLEDTALLFYKHLPTESENAYEIDVPVNEVIDDCIFPDKWELSNTVNLKAGELHFFSPAVWHKIDTPLIQVFYLYGKKALETETAETEPKALEE